MTTPATEAVETAPEGGADDDDAIINALNAREANPLGLPDDDPEGQTPTDAEGTDPAEDADSADPAPTAEADQPEPEGEAPDTPEVDPFAALTSTARPLAYRVNGTERTFDGILEVEGKGALIPADKLADVRNLVARYESNAEATRDLLAFRQDVERLGGVDAFHAQAERTAMTDAAATLILDSLTKNPLQFVKADANGNLVANQERIDFLIQQAGVHAERAKFAYRTELDGKRQTWQAEAEQTSVETDAVPNVIRSTARELGLSDADAEAAIRYFAPFAKDLTYKATPEDAAQYGVKVGTLMVDRRKMEPWFADRIESAKQSKAEAERRAKAEKENAARAVTTPPRNPRNGQFQKPKAKAPAPKPSTKQYSSTELKARVLRGQPIPGDDDFVDDSE